MRPLGRWDRYSAGWPLLAASCAPPVAQRISEPETQAPSLVDEVNCRLYCENQMERKGDLMEIEWSEEVDAVCIRLVEEIGAGGIGETYACDPRQVNGQIQLDFDHEGRLVGIEVLDASRLLRQEALDQGHPIGTPPRSQPEGTDRRRD